MSNKLNPFEDQLQKSVSNHKVSYDAQQWAKLDKQLNASKGTSWVTWGMAAAAIVMISYGVFQITDTHTELETPVVITEIESVAPNNEETNKLDEVKPAPISKEVLIVNQNVNEDKNIAIELKKKESPSKLETINTDETPIEIEVPLPIKSISDEEGMASVSDKEDRITLPVIQLSQSTICAGVALQAYLSESLNSEIEWDLGNGHTSSEKHLNYTYLEEGEYEIRAYIKDINAYSEPVLLVVNPKPDAEILVKENYERSAVPVSYFTANTGGEKSYAWSLGDGTQMKGEGISHTYRKKGDYEVSLRVMNKYGCFWSNFYRHRVDQDFNLLAPTSFSPNGDGINDDWIPVALSSMYYNFNLKIYDRQSKLVFETTDPQQLFDGKVRGKLASSGEVFLWSASTVDPHGVRQEYRGTVMVAY